MSFHEEKEAEKMEMPHWYQRMSLNVSRLIVQVESQPILWDAAEEGYCDRHQTKDAWTLVCRNLYSQWDSATINEQEVIIKDVKNRWRTVRDRFKKYLNKQEQSGSSPCNKKCPYYDELQFLLTSRELRPSEGNIPPPRQTSSEEFEGTSVVVDSQDSSFLETCEDQDGISTSQSSSQAASQSQENNTSTTQVAPRRVNRRRNRSSAQPSVEIEALSSMIQRVEKEDEFDHIGVSLANRIRSLPKQRQPSFMAAMYTLLDAYENPSPIASVSAIVTAIQQYCLPPPPPPPSTEYSNVRHSNPAPPLNPPSQPYGITSYDNAHSATYHPPNTPYSSSFMSYLQMTPPPSSSSHSSYVNSTPSTGSSNSSKYTTRPPLLNLE